MTTLFDALQAHLYGSARDEFATHVNAALKKSTGVEMARAKVVARLTQAWSGLERDETGLSDLAVLARQTIRMYQRRLEIPTTVWERIAANEQRAGLWGTVSGRSGWTELQADDWTPHWLPGSAVIDTLERRQYDRPAVGNGTLQAMLGTSWFTSAAQKAAVEACLWASPGTTTLVTLPTGAGKSLCALLPAWCDSAGGRIAGGTTLVVVPTVSLALDQHEQACERFPDAMNDAASPQVWIGTTDTEKRTTIERGIRAGTLPILYTSPEALAGPWLQRVCLEAAANGRLTRLVVDEAHIVETWGAGFRTEFQFLATLRKRLWEVSGGQLRTILLSATVTVSCELLLERLFAGPGPFVTLRANRLRPEPSYWFARFEDGSMRDEAVLNALFHLPRPTILYVTQPEVANSWVARLRGAGFQRLAAYTGLTGREDRRRLLRSWRDGAVDLMVASSAFGLGVDKGDVRAVVHACLPENVDRYYQEVGRGGRDGNAAVSLLCTTAHDKDIAYFMAADQVISTGKAVGRWQGLMHSAQSVPGYGELRLVDIDAPPLYDPGMQPSDLNRQWNEHTLLLLQRAGLLHVTTTRQAVDETADEVSDGQRLQVRLLRPDILDAPRSLEDALGSVRERERQRVTREISRMVRIAADYAAPDPGRCFAEELTHLYPDCAPACGGCPTCRARQRPPTAAVLEFFVEGDAREATKPCTPGGLSPRLAERLRAGPLNLFWSDANWLTNPRGLPELLNELVFQGVAQIVLPEELLESEQWVIDLVGHLANHARVPHLLIPAGWIIDRLDIPLRACPTVIIYPTTAPEADRLHTCLQGRLHELDGAALLRIANPMMWLASESGMFRDRVDGTPHDARALQDWLVADELDTF